MSTVMQDIFAVLQAAPSVTALVGGRVFPNMAPQATKRPFVVCTVVSSVPENSLDGSAATRRVNTYMQVDVYGDSYDSAQQAAAAIDLVISDLSGDLSAWGESTREDYDDIAELHRVSHDFSIWR